MLADAGWVTHLKIGRERLWQFEPGAMEAARRSLEVIGGQKDQALGLRKVFGNKKCL